MTRVLWVSYPLQLCRLWLLKHPRFLVTLADPMEASTDEDEEDDEDYEPDNEENWKKVRF